MNEPAPGVTRREIGLAFVVASAAVAVAQQPPPEDLLGAAREQIKRNSETLRKFQIPTATEPSFAFHP